MTIQDLMKSDKVVLTPAEVADVLGCSPQLIRVQASTNPSLLGFHVCKVGNRVKIPREAFIAWLKENK